MIPWLWVLALAAAEEPPVTVDLGGDVKAFFVVTDPYPWLVISEPLADLLPEASDPLGQGIADLRLKLLARFGERVRLDAHHALTARNALPISGLAGTSAGVALEAPETVDLSWEAETGDALEVTGRTDRLALRATLPGVDVVLGRQPVTFGTGQFFTPMDVVNPFGVATIDTEYKPGIDALRVDAFAGMSGRVGVVAAYAGDWDLDGMLLAASGQTTVGVTDLHALVGLMRSDIVLGAGTASAIGIIGVHADLTVTLPPQDTGEDPFVRTVAGADWRPTGTTTVSGEAYLQTLGAAAAEDYLEVAEGTRFSRGELWQLGRWYAGVALAQEVTPLVFANLAVIGNLTDPSALVAPGISWSAGTDVTVAAGVYGGLGQRPDEVELDVSGNPLTGAIEIDPPDPDALASSVHSEFGLYPTVAYLQMKAYF